MSGQQNTYLIKYHFIVLKKFNLYFFAMYTITWSPEIYHETVFFNSKMLHTIVSETKLDFLDAMEVLQTPAIRQLHTLFMHHQIELLKYFDQKLFDIYQSNDTWYGLCLFKEIFKNCTTLSKYSTKITLWSIVNIFDN